MAEIGNVRPTPPINWPTQPSKITPTDKQKDQDANKNNHKQQQDHSDENDDNNHLDEYA